MHIKRLIMVLFVISSIPDCFSQTDTVLKHATIKIGKSEKGLFIKTYTDFNIYYNDPQHSLTYSDFVLSMNQNNPVKRSARFVTIEAQPVNSKDSVFDYTGYFMDHPGIKNIRLQKDETDTVRLLIYVDVKGIVKYLDLSPMEWHGDDLWVYDMKGHEYKIDVVHQKTKAAFDQLTAKPWHAARIKTLKKQPSKHRIKYDSVDGYMQGILTIIYSGSSLTGQEK
jgi:hypothetical protein